MATNLREFLREQAEKHQAESEAGKAMVKEWRDAIGRLFDQVRQWLKEADPGGVIEIEDSKEEIREPSLSRYRVPRLNLRAFGK